MYAAPRPSCIYPPAGVVRTFRRDEGNCWRAQRSRGIFLRFSRSPSRSCPPYLFFFVVDNADERGSGVGRGGDATVFLTSSARAIRALAKKKKKQPETVRRKKR